MIIIKYLKKKKKKITGRNNYGKITVRHIGGGAKRQYRLIDFSKKLYNQTGIVQAIEEDPNRTANIALIFYQKSGLICYSLCPEGVKARRCCCFNAKKYTKFFNSKIGF